MTEVNEVNIARGGKMADGGGRGGLIKIIIGIIVLAVIGGGAFLLFPYVMGLVGGGGSSRPGETRGLSRKTIAEPHFMDLGNFIVNLTEGRRYLKIKIQLMLNDSETKVYLEARQDEVKDVVLAKLKSLSAESLRSDSGLTVLKNDLRDQIYTLFPNGDERGKSKFPIRKVLITEFYLQ